MLGCAKDSHGAPERSCAANIEGSVSDADLVVCAVLIPGAKTPRLISRKYLRRMEPGSALVDVAVDQGGCAEGSGPTTHLEPRYVEEGLVHYCVRQHARCLSTYLNVYPDKRNAGACPRGGQSGMAGSGAGESGAYHRESTLPTGKSFIGEWLMRMVCHTSTWRTFRAEGSVRGSLVFDRHGDNPVLKRDPVRL